MTNKLQGDEPCHLCGQSAKLRESHIIPSWVYRDEIRGNGGQVLDLNEYRIHGRAMTVPLLCAACELRFSQWENSAKKFGERSEPGALYDAWLLKFATSISWRVLKYHLLSPDRLSGRIQKILAQPYVQETLDCWAQFLLKGNLTGRSKEHRQHLLMVSRDYALRQAIAMTIGCAGAHTFVWSRFSFYAILGLLHSDGPRELNSSAIKVSCGELHRENRLPSCLARFLVHLEEEGFARALVYTHKDKLADHGSTGIGRKSDTLAGVDGEEDS